MSGENGGGYDPTRFARGGAAAEKPPSDSDSAGRWDKHQVFTLRLHLTGDAHLTDGVHAMQYGSEIGWPWMNLEATALEIPASGRVRTRQGWKSGEWLVTARGERLGSAFDQIAEARRLSLKVTEGEVPGDKPIIESISVEPLPEEK